MKPSNPFKISGVGKYLPHNRIESAQLEADLSIPDGWSSRYSGVKERYHVTFESNAFMGAKALDEAIKDAGLQVKDLGLLVSASATFDYPLPNQASLIKWELRVEDEIDFPCIDIDASCLSFVSALDYAAKSLHPVHCRHIAVVSTEIASKGLNPENWETATLFGDAAAAVIVSYDETGESGAFKYALRTYAQGAMNTIIRGGGNQYFFRDHPYDPVLHSFSMDGMKLLRLAKAKIPEFMNFFFRDLPWGLEEIDWILPHQASKAGLMVFRSLYDLDDAQVCSNLEMQGNCIAASIPSLLVDIIRSGDLQEGQTCLLSGTSAGFSIGGILIRY